MSFQLSILTCFLAVPLLASCTPPPTQAEAQATAVVAGCWPGNLATPRAVTVTPDPLLTTPMLAATATTGLGTPTSSTGSGQAATAWPTVTRAATTTPYPRCTPGPNETLVPYPTPAPARAPYPTQAPRLRQGGSDMQTTLQLPGHTYGLTIAVHPTAGWPVIGITQRFDESTDPIQSFVRVFNPHANSWGPAQQVDTGSSSNGQDRFGSTVVGVTGDDTVQVVYGASDRDWSDGDPPMWLWARTSTDYGASWSAPQRIARDCWVADAMATTAQGWIVVTANCYLPHGLGEVTPQPALIVRQPDGTWLEPARIAIPDWYGAEGTVVIVGDGEAARAIALRFGALGSPNGTAYLISKRLADGGDWQVAQRAISVPYGDTGERPWHPSGLVFPQTRPNGTMASGVIFTWTGVAITGAYALTSLDGGLSWGAVEPIVYDARDPLQGGIHVAWVAPAYDPAANRLLAIWTCCGDATFAPEESTHYASWSVPGSGVWSPGQVPGRMEPLIPVVLGSRSAWNSVAAHSINARSVWFAWVEQGNQINVRTLNLNQIIPIGAYPTPTLRPSATPTTGGTP